MQSTLSGWTVATADDGQPPSISLRHENGQYVVDALVLEAPKNHAAVVDALNEVFVCIAYLLCSDEPDSQLLHCGAYERNGRNTVVVGRKRSGKSVWIYKMAHAGAVIHADDILLWQPRAGLFKALGLPLRLRRPLVWFGAGVPNPNRFFASDGIAYSRVGAYKIAPAGSTFLIDEVLVMSACYTPTKVPLHKMLKVLKSHVIGAEYTTIKKTDL